MVKQNSRKEWNYMHRQNVIATGFFAIVFVLVLIVGDAKGWGHLGVFNLAGDNSPISSSDGLVSPSQSRPAPDLAVGKWINSQPLTLKSLRGRVVLIEFWTFGCYNCRNTLPYV